MSTAADLIMAFGGLVAVLAGVGLLKFDSPYARFHAAGKASPVAFVIAAIGAGYHLGWDGATYLLIASVAMVLTLPIGVHLMFRAVHRTTSSEHLSVDELPAAERRARS